MDRPSRRPTRLPGFDYSTANYYFVTICTFEKQCLFGNPDALNNIGMLAYSDMQVISDHYEGVTVDCFVVMPNHIHAIIALDSPGISLDKIIGQYKSGVSRKANKLFAQKPIWQRSFHDHIIRNQASYEKIWTYVVYNAQKWEEDCFYPGKSRNLK